MRFLLDTNVISDLVRHPRGQVADRIAQIGEQHVCSSVIVAAESRYGAARKDSARLAAQLEAVLGFLLAALHGSSAAAMFRWIRTDRRKCG